MNEQYYKNIINSLPYGLLVLNEGLTVIECNQSCERLLSKTKLEILGRDLSDVISHRELRSQAISVLQNGGTKLVELYFDSESPKILKVVLTAIATDAGDKDHLGSPLCLLVLEDIGERVRLEEQLVQSEKLAGMGLVATSVAHELGNPLGIISSTLQYIQTSLPKTANRQLVEAIETIMEGVRQMHELLRSLSEFTGSQRPHFESTDLLQLLFQMIAFITKEAESHEIKVYTHFDERLPKCQFDPKDIKRMFLNLLKNAMEAMPNGGVLHIRAYLLKDKDSVCVEFSDTGCGISEAELRSIFRPFYSTKSSGTGLGLPFCRRIAEEHGGEIKVKSKLNKGSVFSVILPVKQGGDADESAESSHSSVDR